MKIKSLLKKSLVKLGNVMYAERAVVNLTPSPCLKFEVNLVDHCNLQCKYCDHFSPLAKKHELDPENFERDLQRLSKLMPGMVCEIRLMGGEPLLNSRVSEFPRIARKYFPDADVWFLTNGLLLMKMSEEFYRECKENYVGIHVTKYPVDFDYDKAEKYVEEKGVMYNYFGSNVAVKTMFKGCFNFTSLGDPVKNFTKCGRTKCHALREGKLFICPVIPTSFILNDYFNTSLPIAPNDYIDIYKAQSGDEILNFLAKPASFCRFCNTSAITGEHKWKKSDKTISEYINHDPADLPGKFYSRNFKLPG